MKNSFRSLKPALIAGVLGAMMLVLSGSAVAQSGPCLQVGPDTLDYYFNACADPADWQGLDSLFVMVSNCGDGTLNWTMSSSEPWVGFEPPSGGNFDSVLVYIDPGSMPTADPEPGDTVLFGAILTIEDPDADYSPQYVAVNLYIHCAEEGYTLGVYPSSFDYTAVQNQTLTGTLHVYEFGGANIQFEITNFSDWLTLPMYFVPPVTPDSVPFTIVTDDLLPGTYYDSIMVYTLLEAWNSPTIIPVTLTVTDSSGYTLAASPTSIDFTLDVDESAAAESLYVYEMNGASIEFWTYNYSDWLYIDTVWGEQVTPSTVIAVASASGLSPGLYIDTVFISAYDAPTIAVPVTLTVGGPGYTLGVYPSYFNYTATQNQTLTGVLSVYELGGANIEFDVSNFTDWLQLPVYFTPPVTPDSVPFGIITDGLAPGTYYDSIMVSSLLEAWNSPTFVPVTLTVTDSGYTLATHPSNFVFTLDVGESIAAESLYVYEMSGASIEFWTYNYSDWLYIDTVWGEQVTPSLLSVVASASGLSPGVYGDTVFISAYEAETITVPVTLIIEESGGEYSVLTNPQALDISLFPGSAESTSLEVYEAFGRLVWFEVSENSPWLGVFGEPPLVTPTTLTVVFDASDLAAGWYHDSIHIYSADDTMSFEPVAVPVTLTVFDEMPVVHALPDNFAFSLEYGSSVRDVGMLIYEQSGMSVPFSVQKQNNSAWLQVQGGQQWVTPDSVYFDIFMAGYEPGQYADTLIIFNPLDDTLWYEPVYIPIVVTLTDDPGEYVVEVAPYYLELTLATGEFRSDTLHVYEAYGNSVPFMFWNREPWLFVDTYLDTIPPYFTPLTLHVYTDASSLEPGFYVDTVFIYPDSIPFQPVAAPVFLTVTGGTTDYVVETAPTLFEVTLSYGEFAVDSLYVYEVYDRQVPFTFENSQYWVFVNPLGMPPYSTPDMLTVVIDSDTLSAGVHTDTIWIYPASRGMAFTPVSVPVTMTVVSGLLCGDADGSGKIDIDDIVTMINYVFSGGTLNVPLETGDVDCDGVVIIDDIVVLVTYIFMGGPAPCAECT